MALLCVQRVCLGFRASASLGFRVYGLGFRVRIASVFRVLGFTRTKRHGVLPQEKYLMMASSRAGSSLAYFGMFPIVLTVLNRILSPIVIPIKDCYSKGEHPHAYSKQVRDTLSRSRLAAAKRTLRKMADTLG